MPHKKARRAGEKSAATRRTSRIEFIAAGPPLKQAQLSRAADILACPGRGLPEEFARFLLKRNGCRTEPRRFDWKHPKDGIQSSSLDRLVGIDLGPHDMNRDVDSIDLILRLRDYLPRDLLPIGFVDRDDILVLFVGGSRRGQVWIKMMDEILDAEFGRGKRLDRDAATYFVANSFTEFLNSLYEPPDPHICAAFALDAPRVRGGRLAALLKSMGCRRHRPLPLTWHWPKYETIHEIGGPAWIVVEKNKTYGHSPKFDARPAGHKILLVTVTETQRAECVRELAAALGDGAALLDDGMKKRGR